MLGYNFFEILTFMAAVVLLGLVVLLIGLPLTASSWVYQVARTASERWRLNPRQRTTLRELDRRLQACRVVARRLDPFTSLDGVLQGQCVRDRNTLVSKELSELFELALESLRVCRAVAVPEPLVRRVWDAAAEEIGFHMDIATLSETFWRHDNPLSPMVR